jgi:hypothetical protein
MGKASGNLAVVLSVFAPGSAPMSCHHEALSSVQAAPDYKAFELFEQALTGRQRCNESGSWDRSREWTLFISTRRQRDQDQACRDSWRGWCAGSVNQHQRSLAKFSISATLTANEEGYIRGAVYTRGFPGSLTGPTDIIPLRDVAERHA